MTGLYFLDTHQLGAELGTFPPFVVREAVRLHDNRPKIVKVYSKMGQTPEEQHQIHTETQFWSLVRHPRIIEIEHVYDEEGFIYIVYEFPEGGDLAALILEETRTFTEGFAKKIAAALLDALIFLHGNGIMHGAVTPANIVFDAPAHVPGWADQCKLSFFRVDNRRNTTVFQDIQDLAFTTVSIMRRTPGLLSRTYFSPDVLQKAEWSHVTDDFVDFIEQLWFCEEKYRMAETYTSHPWLTTKNVAASVQSETPAELLVKSVKDNSETIEGFLYYKMREKKNGRRQWHRRWAVVRHGMLLMYLSPDEDDIDNQELCQALNLKNKTIFVYTMGKHDFMCGLQDVVQQKTILWLRFDTEKEYTMWKEFLLRRHEKEVSAQDPKSDENKMTSIVAPKSSNLASSLATNLVNNLAASQRQQSPSEEGKSAISEERVINEAEALVQAVDDVAKEFSRQILAQANNYVRRSKLLQRLRGSDLKNKQTSLSFNHSLSPYPSEQKCRVHPAIKWDMRAEELMLVQATGTPVNKPVSEGEEWFIIDATWFKHWISFVASKRRRAPPGPIDNLWMINPETDVPYEHMVEDSDDISGDFRRVPPQIWQLFETWYGGGPAISIIGPPTEDTRRWVIHIEEASNDMDKDEKSVVDLMGKLDHPEDVINMGDEKKESHLAIDLHKGTRRPSLAEMNLLAKVGGFHDGGHDKVSSGLDAIDSSDEDSEEVGDAASRSTGGSFTKYPALTVDALKVLDTDSTHDEQKVEGTLSEISGAHTRESLDDKRAVKSDKKADGTASGSHPQLENAPKKKRSSIFSRH